MTKEQRSEIFLHAAELVRKGWCQGHNAENNDGNPCLPQSEFACKFCLEGAVVAACGVPSAGEIPPDVMALLVAESHFAPSLWNDAPDRTQAEVVELLERLAE